MSERVEVSQEVGQGERLSRICDWMCVSRGGLIWRESEGREERGEGGREGERGVERRKVGGEIEEREL